MRVKAHQRAIDFEVKDIFDNPINLSDFKGKKLMLSFYRYASCPLCNLRIHNLIKNYESLKDKELNMLAFFQSPKESILKYVGKQDAPFPLVADTNRIVYKQYGVESSWLGFAKVALKIPTAISAMTKGFFPRKLEGDLASIPADFLIGRDLTIQKAYYGKDIGDHIPLEDIEAWLKSY